MPDDLMAALSAHGWELIDSRTTSNGLTLFKLGRYHAPTKRAKVYEETEERSVGGWEMWIQQEGDAHGNQVLL